MYVCVTTNIQSFSKPYVFSSESRIQPLLTTSTAAVIPSHLDYLNSPLPSDLSVLSLIIHHNPLTPVAGGMLNPNINGFHAQNKIQSPYKVLYVPTPLGPHQFPATLPQLANGLLALLQMCQAHVSTRDRICSCQSLCLECSSPRYPQALFLLSSGVCLNTYLQVKLSLAIAYEIVIPLSSIFLYSTCINWSRPFAIATTSKFQWFNTTKAYFLVMQQSNRMFFIKQHF